MTSNPPPSAIRYPQRTLVRADRAVRCAPFGLRLYTTMITQSVALPDVSGSAGRRYQFTHRAISATTAERELMWLMQVGLLRREVDGQGLTDSFRITPLGRLLVEKWQNCGVNNLQPTLGDRIYNAMCRWLRLPV
jgi:hypothetical protein